MASRTNYIEQVELIVQVLPEIFENQELKECFALKGGTAINLFIRDMPRLSVDIDLAYLPKEPREVFLKNLTSTLEKLSDCIMRNIKGTKIQKNYSKDNWLSKFVVHKDLIKIKIEGNVVLRETLYDCENKELCRRAQNQFLQFLEARTISFAELYAGKICATLDRHHPRDLFDTKLLLENEGITPEIRKAFIAYLASGPRPMGELLAKKQIDVKSLFDSEFLGMTDYEINYQELANIRDKLLYELLNSLTENERKFLLSLKLADPDWSLLDIDNIADFPSIKWKLLNIRKMEKSKRELLTDNLKRILDL